MFRIAGFLRVVSLLVVNNCPTAKGHKANPVLAAKVLIVLGMALLFVQAGLGQGIEPFSTQAPGPFSTVDLASTNVFVSIPIRSKVGALPIQMSATMNSAPQGGGGGNSLGVGILGLYASAYAA